MSDEKPTNNLLLLQEYLMPNIQKPEQINNAEKPSQPVILEGQPPPPDQLPMILEALLLVSNQPLTLEHLNQILHRPGKNLLYQSLMDLQQTWNEERRGIQILQVANGWQIRSNPQVAHWVREFLQGKPKKLSKAALEALSIIAYRQPVTRSEVDQIRGVDSNAVIQKLQQLQLVTGVGKKEDDPGKPILLGTTDEFLSLFNLRDLLDLPTLKDL